MLVEIPPEMSVAGYVGFLKGKSSLIIFQAVCESEIQIWEQHILVPGILCGYSGQECKEDSGVYPKSVKGRSGCGSDDTKRIYRSV